MTQTDRGDRASFLEFRRTTKMASSTHAYVRGNTRLFYEWLDNLPPSDLL